VLPPIDREGKDKYWFMVRDASRLIYLNQNEKALAVIKEVLSEYPDAAVPQLFAGRLYNRLDEYDKGLDYLKKFLAQKSLPEPYNLAQGYFWAGLANDQLNNREDAVYYYSQALELQFEDMPGGIDGLLQFARHGTESKLSVDNGVIQIAE